MCGRNYITILTLSIWALAGACKKDFIEINTDPGQITGDQINYNYLFTSAQLLTSGNTDGYGYEDWRNNLIYSGCMIQHLSSTISYWVGDKYMFDAGYNSAYWDKNYPNSIADIVEVLHHAQTDTGEYNLYQICRIFKAFMFQRMTDMYGDCPYSEAGQGYIAGITTPKYDWQQDIYTDLLKELKDAAEKLDPARGNSVGSADLLYKGDVLSWKKFAYSEMVRVAMRLSKITPDTARRWVWIAVNGGVMSSNTDNAILHHENVTGTPDVNGSGLVLLGNDPGAYRLSETFVSFLRNTADPRLSYLATVCADPLAPADKGDTTFSRQLGQPNGYDPPGSGGTWDLANADNWTGSQNDYSVVNRYTFSRLDAPTFFLTKGETELLLTEASQRGWISEDPAAHYQAGVRAAMQQLSSQAGAGPSDAQIDGWLASHPYDPAKAFRQINEQYWVAGFMDENECFANWRRSGYPILTPINYPSNVTGGAIPRRFTYPQSEASTNGAHYNSAVSRLANGDRMTSRVWWDK
ncbi:MAG TPA: SusD/RagB family nutrient-binding outer membrane lipoprotein [Puia sp.]|nr:SusD/RagB family nutrient-binding outer membrane lipoprotein [Puia sp.]